MRNYVIIALSAFLIMSCTTNQKSDGHITFGGLEINGNLEEFLQPIMTHEVRELSEGSFKNLELQITEISNKSFKCSYHGLSPSTNILWFEVFPGVDHNNDCVCSLEARSLINNETYQVLLSCLQESLGYPDYSEKTYTDELIENLGDLDPLAYLEPEGESFYIWVTNEGYVIVEILNSHDNGVNFIVMNVVDQKNFKQYLLSQLYL